MDTLESYKATGFSSNEIIRMYEDLIVAQDIICDLISGNYRVTMNAVDEAMVLLEQIAKYRREKLH